MSDRYLHRAIETKWQATWEEQGLYDTVEDADRPKWYALTMLPYTSGDLHTGHWYAMTPSDAAAALPPHDRPQRLLSDWL